MDYPKTPSFNLNGKRSLVTGAGRGIGMGASIALAQAGSEIVMVARTEKQLISLNNHIKNLGLKSSYKSFTEYILPLSSFSTVRRAWAEGCRRKKFLQNLIMLEVFS